MLPWWQDTKDENETRKKVFTSCKRHLPLQNRRFHLWHKIAGKTTWHKLKSIELQAARCEAREVLKTGILVQRKQAARTLAEFSQEELGRYENAAEMTRKKADGFHAKVLTHWPGGSNISVASAKKQDVEKCITDAVGACGASHRNQVIQFLWRVFQRALAARAIGSNTTGSWRRKNQEFRKK